MSRIPSDFPVTIYISSRKRWIALIPSYAVLLAMIFLISARPACVGQNTLPILFLLWALLFFHRIISPKILRAHYQSLHSITRADYANGLILSREFLQWTERHPFLDRHRAILLSNPSACSLREVALYNIAECQWHLGRWDEALENYRAILRDNPNNKMAYEFLERYESTKAYLESKTRDAGN